MFGNTREKLLNLEIIVNRLECDRKVRQVKEERDQERECQERRAKYVLDALGIDVDGAAKSVAQIMENDGGNAYAQRGVLKNLIDNSKPSGDSGINQEPAK